MSNVIPFKEKSYEAQQLVLSIGAQEFRLAGTLEGDIDLAILESDGSHRTYPLTVDEAHILIAALHSVVSDIQKNCLFDADPLLRRHP